MKKLPLLLISIILLSSCDEVKIDEEYPQYSIILIEAVPDSLEDEHRAYIIKITSSASYHMSAGEYEQPRMTIWAAQRLANELYTVPMDGLLIQKDEHYYNDIEYPYHKLNSFHKAQFNLLKTPKP